MVDSLEIRGEEASKFGLEMNWSKTKIQPLGAQGAIPDHVLLAGNQMEQVREFCYTGSHVEADSGSGPVVLWHVAIARGGMT